MPTPQDLYVEKIVASKPAATIPSGALAPLVDIVKAWAGIYLVELKLSGSYSKGTAIAGSSDIDVLISLKDSVLSGNTPTLSKLYHSLDAYLKGSGYATRLQNVSIGVKHNGICVDLVPAVKRPGNTNDHTLFKRRKNSWTLTNIDTHINHVKNSGRTFDIKAVKIWRNLHKLDISSFYLELVVLEALSGRPLHSPATNFTQVMDYLVNKFVGRNILDPANTANYISDELDAAQQRAISSQAAQAKNARYWGDIIW